MKELMLHKESMSIKRVREINVSFVTIVFLKIVDLNLRMFVIDVMTY